MNSTLLLAAILLTGALIGAYALRRASDQVRFMVDLTLFSATSVLLAGLHVSPLFVAAITDGVADEGLGLRALTGAWWLLAARLMVGLLRLTLHRDRRSREARLFSDLIAGTIYVVAGFIVLNSVLALPVRGVLATSGILAVVLGLALQNTLSDVFSGIAVGIEAPFRVDDRIMIDGKVEGQVIQVNWRSIRILTDSNDVAIFPNSLVAKAQIVNRSFPTSRRSGSIDISCTNRAAPERVMEVLLEAALLSSSIERKPPASVVLVEIKRRTSVYRISFSAANSHALATGHDQLMQRCRQQLYFAGMLPDQRSSETESQPPKALQLTDSRVLEELVLFESLSQEEIAHLSACVRSRIIKSGESLFAEGSADATLYIVTSGLIDISRKGAGGQEFIGCVGAGEYVGEIGLFTGAPHAATATASTRTRVLQLSKDSIEPLIANNPQLAESFEEAVQRGMELLHHGSAAHVVMREGATSQLLHRIRLFFAPPAGARE